MIRYLAVAVVCLLIGAAVGVAVQKKRDDEGDRARALFLPRRRARTRPFRAHETPTMANAHGIDLVARHEGGRLRLRSPRSRDWVVAAARLPVLCITPFMVHRTQIVFSSV